MVDISDLAKAQRLNQERFQIDRALTMLDQGSVITAFGIGPKEQAEPTPPFMVQSSYMETPPQMIETIKTLLHQREDQITSELASIGVTGVAPQPRK